MRKMVFLLVVFLAAGGALWAQLPSRPNAYADPPGAIFDIPDLFTAVSTLSTEARYSAGRFSSDVDDYIDPRYYNPGIGTFFFLGGYPSTGNANSVHQTDVLTSNPYTISGGIGKTVKAGYFGVYYGGSFVNAYGMKWNNAGDPKTYDTYAYSTWRNNLAVLFGISGMGFRFDLVMDGPAEDEKDTEEDGKYKTYERLNGAGVSLTWGASMGSLFPYVTLGFDFADQYETENSDGKKMSYTSGGTFGLLGGADYDLTDHSGLSAGLIVGAQFAENYKGDETLLGEKPWKEGGGFGMGLNAGYYHRFDFGSKVALKIKPGLRLGFTSFSNNTTQGGNSDKFPSDNYFTLRTGIDMGLSFQPNSKFAFYTGAGLQFFEWNTHGRAGGTESTGKTKASEWEFNGLEWDATKAAAGGRLGFGMTFSPEKVKGLVVGAGLNTLLDKLFVIDLQQMQVRSGSAFTQANTDQNNSLGQSLFFFNGLTFDLTVSYKF